MNARRRWGATTIRTVFGLMVVVAATGQSEETRVPEVVYRGEMVSYPGPWAFSIRKPGVIFVSDAEIETLTASLHVVRFLITRDVDL